jgi:outer membrane protein OmpA-like peptidoglycan-associated protein
MISPNAQLALGYQFSPVWAVRLAANAWQSKGGFGYGPSKDETYKWNYVAPGLDVKFNLINAIAGYNPNRKFGLNLIAGAAANIAWKNDDAQKFKGIYNMSKLWDGTQILPVGRFGFDIDYALSSRVSLNLEGMANVTTDKLNSKTKNEKKNADWYFNALLGLKIALGKTQNVIPVPAPVVVVEEPTPAPVVKPQPKPQPPIVKPAPEMQTEIFYAIRETIPVGAEKAKVDNLIKFLKDNPQTKVSVTGYADVGTGNPKINLGYSQGRAQNVAKALTDAGIDASRITVDAKGDTVQPFSENDKNRVTIAIAE